MDESLYETLQVDQHADPEVIDVTYRRLARKYHPDTGGSDSSENRMRSLNQAYEILNDPSARKAV
ncbi:MAG: DnaJ domain-containing protein [Chloroflexi bacterium]|nr:DnaJ domain-containing protein [Chloroflexota bacterium]